MIAEGSPAELWELNGEELWKKKQGPKKASLEKCDLGMGPGVVKGAYARLPRYFNDTHMVQDLESRLVTCMVTLQGRDEKDVTKHPFGNANKPTENEYLVSYVVGQSRGHRMAVSTAHPKARQAYEIGKELFFYRAGPWDFSCASCHGEEGKRIRMSELPVLYKPEYARPLMSTWPAYRVSTSKIVTLQWRMNDCYRQMRMPEPAFGSDTTVALITFMTQTAEGVEYRGPAIKR